MQGSAEWPVYPCEESSALGRCQERCKEHAINWEPSGSVVVLPAASQPRTEQRWSEDIYNFCLKRAANVLAEVVGPRAAVTEAVCVATAAGACSFPCL